MLAPDLVEELFYRSGKPLLSFLQPASYAVYRFTVVLIVGPLEQAQRIFDNEPGSGILRCGASRSPVLRPLDEHDIHRGIPSSNPTRVPGALPTAKLAQALHIGA